MKYELGFYLNPHGENRREIMQALAEHEVKWIGIDGSSWDADKDVNDILEFKREFTECGLSLYTLHSALPLLAAPDKTLPDELFRQQIQELKKGALLECKRVVYHFCMFQDCPFEESDKAINKAGKDLFLKNQAQAINKLAAVAAKLNITLVIENVYVSSYSESFDLLKEIIALSKTKNVGICIDTGHALLANNNPAEKIIQAGDLLMDTHFHDNFGKDAPLPPCAYSRPEAYRRDLHLPPGMGLINWPEVCTALRDVKFSGPIMFEGVMGPGDCLEKGNFKGKMSYSDLIKLTIENWRAFELLG
jgi:sugar phosphate isomerase/epimerase